MISKENSIFIAQETLNDKYIFRNFSYVYSEINSGIDKIWHEKFDNNSHEYTCHSLFILYDLLYAYLIEKDDKYLQKGKEIIESWIHNNPRLIYPVSLMNSRFSWGDHSTANRIIAVLIFWDYYSQIFKDEEFNRNVQLLTNKSLKNLKNPMNYQFEHNHGMFQDMALLVIGLHSKNNHKNQIFHIAVKRIEKQVLALFSNKGIHMENSPDYHCITLNLYYDFLMFLDLTNISLKSEVTEKIKLAEDNLSYFVKQNDVIANIGDTPNDQYCEINEHRYGVIICQEAGFLIHKTESCYFLVRINYGLPQHRHNDSSSYIFYLDGFDAISETGFLNYVKDFEGKYSRSSLAHNTIVVDKNSNFDVIIDSLYYADSNLFYLKLFGKVNKNNIIREFILLPLEKILIVRDKNEVPDSKVLFHLSNKLDLITHKGQNEFKAYKSNINFSYFTDNYFNELIYGDNNQIPSYRASNLKKLEPNYSILSEPINRNTFASLVISRLPLEISISNDSLFIFKSNNVIKDIKISSESITYDSNYINIERITLPSPKHRLIKFLPIFKRRFFRFVFTLLITSITFLMITKLKHKK
jgi:hypothetical protein